MSFWLGAFLKRRRQRREEMLSALEAEYNVKARDEDEVSARSGNHPVPYRSRIQGAGGAILRQRWPAPIAGVSGVFLHNDPSVARAYQRSGRGAAQPVPHPRGGGHPRIFAPAVAPGRPPMGPRRSTRFIHPLPPLLDPSPPPRPPRAAARPHHGLGPPQEDDIAFFGEERRPRESPGAEARAVIQRFDSFEGAEEGLSVDGGSLEGGVMEPGRHPRALGAALLKEDTQPPETKLEMARKRRAQGARDFREALGQNYEVWLCWLQTTPLYAGAKWVVEHPMFEVIVFMAILANSVLLGMYSYNQPPDSKINKASTGSDIYFLAIFIAEAAIKLFVYGYLYFAEPWNLLDFTVVVTGVVELVPGTGESNLSALRVARVLRPLKVAHILPGLKRLVSTILSSMRQLGNIFVVFVYVLIVFGLLGLSLFQGALGRRCVQADPGDPGSPLLDATGGYVLETPDEPDATCTSFRGAFSGHLCGDGFLCVETGMYPNLGVSRFTNFFWTSLLNFQVTTLEGWTVVMYLTMDATSGFALLYFVILVFVGALFLVNLVLAVITSVYDTNSGGEDAEKQEEEVFRVLQMLPGYRVVSGAGRWVSGVWSRHSLELPDEGALGWVKARCKELVVEDSARARHFSYIITGLIFVNLISLSLVWDGQDPKFEQALEIVNVVMVACFLFEMVLRFLALGIKGYFADTFNVLDFFINAISILELTLGESGSLSALRAMRAFRALKLLQRYPTLQMFLNAMTRCVLQLGNFFLMVALTMVVFALLGMNLLGGKLEGVDAGGKLEEPPRITMDTLPWAMLYIFQIMTGEDWNALMYDAIFATSPYMALFFIVVIILGTFIVVNLFIAILLSNFSALHEENNAKLQKEREVRLALDHRHNVDGEHRSFVGLAKGKLGFIASRIATKRARPDRPAVDPVSQASPDAEAFPLPPGEGSSTSAPPEDGETPPEDGADSEKGVMELMGRFAMQEEAEAVGDLSTTSVGWGCPKALKYYNNKSFFFMDKRSPVRQAVFRVVDRKSFDLVILVLIVAASITMALETPGNMARESFKNRMEIVDVCFTAVFLLELILKVVAMGFVGDEGAYLNDPWNVIDGAIVLFGVANSILAFTVTSSELGALRAVRVVRVLRPLRVIKRVPELRLVVTALLRSLPGISSVMIVALFFWFIFGIIGINLFKGALYACNDGSVATRAECVGTFTDDSGETVERVWRNARQHFDHLGAAMLTLFEISTTEGWVAVMLTGIDSVGKDLQPQENYNVAVALYFVFFMLVANFLLLNMFVGIVLDNFSQVRDEQGSLVGLTPKQEEWVKAHTYVVGPLTISAKSARPRNEFRGWVYDLVTHPMFDLGIAIAISVNTIFMLTSHYSQPGYWTDALNVVDLIFTVLYTAEMCVKLVGLGVAGYFRVSWNQLDFTVVALGLMEQIFRSSFQGSESTALRAVRVARVIRVLKTWKGLQAMFHTLFASLPSMANVGGLMFLIFWIYSVLGMNLFGTVNKRTGEELNANANFENVGVSMLTLLRMATGEAWNSIMHDVMETEAPYCCPDSYFNEFGACPENTQRGDCGSKALAVFYFVTFTVICTFILINLFLAIVLDNYAAITAGTVLSHSDVQDFRMLWAELDPGGTGFLPCRRLLPLLEALPGPLGFATVDAQTGRVIRGSRWRILEMLSKLEMKTVVVEGIDSPMVFYKDVLVALSCAFCDIHISSLPTEIIATVSDRVESLRTAQASDALRAKHRRMRAIQRHMKREMGPEALQRSLEEQPYVSHGGVRSSLDGEPALASVPSNRRAVPRRSCSGGALEGARRRPNVTTYEPEEAGPLAGSFDARATLTGLTLARLANGFVWPEDRISEPPRLLAGAGAAGADASDRAAGPAAGDRGEGPVLEKVKAALARRYVGGGVGRQADAVEEAAGVVANADVRLVGRVAQVRAHLEGYRNDVQVELFGTRHLAGERPARLVTEGDGWADGAEDDGVARRRESEEGAGIVHSHLRSEALSRALKDAVAFQAEELVLVAAERLGIPTGADGLPVERPEPRAILDVANLWDVEVANIVHRVVEIGKDGLRVEEEVPARRWSLRGSLRGGVNEAGEPQSFCRLM